MLKSVEAGGGGVEGGGESADVSLLAAVARSWRQTSLHVEA